MAERDVDVELDRAVPHPLRPEIEIRLGFVDEAIAGARFDASGRRVALRLAAACDAQRAQEIAGKVRRLVGSMSRGALLPEEAILERHAGRGRDDLPDPMPALLASHEVVCELDGVVALGPRLARLVAYVDARLQAIADGEGASPYRFPTLISARVLERLDYFRAFPHTLTFATHLRRDLDVLDGFARSACCGEHGLGLAADAQAPVAALLSPAVCYHLYRFLEGRTVAEGGLAATMVGHCFRQEGLRLGGLERLWDFTMREIVFVGSPDDVRHGRDRVREAVRRLFADLGLAYVVQNAHDSFFVGEFARQTVFQQAFELKQELRAALPFAGTTLAVGSFNYHQDFFGRRLDVRQPSGAPVHTTCCAFGLERLAYAFVAQHGADEGGWPPAVREGVATGSHARR